ncbi:MAG: RDD family protein [Oceanococcus sp.]
MAEIIQPAPFMRRLGAAFYDGLLLLGLWIGMTFVAVLFNDGEPVAAGSRWYGGILIGIAMVFNAWFWTHGGQTLGMRAWRLQIRREVDCGPLGWGRAGWRFAIALPAWGCAGLGVFWALLHPQNKTWQDLLSGTETILLPPPAPDQHIPE